MHKFDAHPDVAIGLAEALGVPMRCVASGAQIVSDAGEVVILVSNTERVICQDKRIRKNLV